jgi:hypothetical protein
MEEPAEPTEETKHSRGFGRYAFWAGVVLVLYVLSWGAALKMAEKRVFESGSAVYGFIKIVYIPLGWAYEETSLHKPLGIYLHLWRPQRYDKNGDRR